MTRTLSILGCGSSAGVPRVAQGWGACDPANPRNRRRRCSILVEQADEAGVTRALVDTSPDLREQLLASNVARLDAILLTHPHADHIHGIDDIRPMVAQMDALIDVHMDAPTSAVMRQGFRYVFETLPGSNYAPLAREHRLEHGKAASVNGHGGAIEFLPFALDHGDIESLGFRFGNVAYTPDLARIPTGSWRFLENLDLWIVDALRYTSHPTHLSVPETLDLILQLRPRRAILTNLSNELDYAELCKSLPENVEPAYDGMRVEI